MPFEPAPIQSKGGLEANVQVHQAKERELMVTTDSNKLYVGKGQTNLPVPVKMDSQNVNFTNNDFESTNVSEALNELFQFANSGKTQIATAIGDPITSENTFSEMATAIGNEKDKIKTFINRAEGNATSSDSLSLLTNQLEDVRVFRQTVKFRKAPNSTTTIQLLDIVPEDRLVVTPLIRVNDDVEPNKQTRVIATFDNGDEEDFEPYPNDYVEFSGGTAKLKNDYSYTLYDDIPNIQVTNINISEFLGLKEITINPTTITLKAVPKPRIIKASGDIDIQDVIDIVQTINNSSLSANFAISFDSGNRWFGTTSGTSDFNWQQINMNDVNDFEAKTTWRILYIDSLHALRYLDANQNPNTIRFAYLLKDGSYNTAAKTILNSMSIDVVINGTFVPEQRGNAFFYDDVSGVITVNHSSYDTYMINYLDKLPQQEV